MDADFSSLRYFKLFKEAPESAAAGWLHYLAFDFGLAHGLLEIAKKMK